MRKPFALLFSTLLLFVSARAQKAPANFILVDGGMFRNAKSNYIDSGGIISSFLMGKYEVTQKEWVEVMGSNPSKFQGDDLPVDTVNWYDCIEYCNQRSLREGLNPYYMIEKDRKDPHNQTVIDDIKWTVTINKGANGYRLPTEAEWEYAAGGGQLSKSFTYSGGDEIGAVAWFWQNAGDKPLVDSWSWPAIQKNNTRTHAVGGKAPNELGLYDMSGNVREWCWDWYADTLNPGSPPNESSAESGRVWRGGGWIGGDFCCTPAFRAGFEANGKGGDQGFRVCRSR